MKWMIFLQFPHTVFTVNFLPNQLLILFLIHILKYITWLATSQEINFPATGALI